MSAAETELWTKSDHLQHFLFDGAYGGQVSKTDGRSQRSQKRTGLWRACFAPPPVKESSPPSTVVSAPSQLALTAQQLLYQRAAAGGAPNTLKIPISDISNVDYKWIEAGGARVSKVTLTLPGRDPLVIRGLKDPQALVDAISRQRKETPRDAVSQEAASAPPPRTQPTGHRPAGADLVSADRGGSTPGRSAAGSHGATPDVPNPRIVARALFTNSPDSSVSKLPTSAGDSACSGMTKLSPFARSPAQEFSGAASIAKELLMASPGVGSAGVASTPAPDPDSEPPYTIPATAASPPSGATRRASPAAPGKAPPPPPPPVPSDSVAAPAAFVPGSGGSAASPRAGWPPTRPPLAGGSPPPPADDSVVLSLSHHQLAQGSPTPTRLLAGGSPPPKAEDSVMSGPQQALSPGGSPYPTPRKPGEAPDSLPEDDEASLQLPPPATHTAVAHPEITPAVDEDTDAATVATMPAPTAGGELPESGRSGYAATSSAGPSPQHQQHPVTESAGVVAAPAPLPPLPGPVPPLQLGTRPEGDHRRPHASVPAPATNEGSVAEAATAASAYPRAASATSFQSAGSQDLAERASAPEGSSQRSGRGAEAGDAAGQQPLQLAASAFVAASGSNGDAADAVDPPDAPPQQQQQQREGKNVTTVGALGIAAAAATMSAVLTTAASAAASAGLGSVGLAAAPSLAGAASAAAAASVAPAAAAAAASTTAAAAAAAAPVAAAAVAASSVVAAPLTLLGVTAAAAMTLVAAAAVTHIRTGSPVRPLDVPHTKRDAEGAELLLEAAPPPSLSARALEAQLPVLQEPGGSTANHRSAMTLARDDTPRSQQPVDAVLPPPAAAAAAPLASSPARPSSDLQPARSYVSTGVGESSIREDSLVVPYWAAAPSPVLAHHASYQHQVVPGGMHHAPQLLLLGTHMPPGVLIASPGAGVALSYAASAPSPVLLPPSPAAVSMPYESAGAAPPPAYACPEGVRGGPPVEAVAEVSLLRGAPPDRETLQGPYDPPVPSTDVYQTGSGYLAPERQEPRELRSTAAAPVVAVHGGELRPPPQQQQHQHPRLAAERAAAAPAADPVDPTERSRWRLWGAPQDRQPDFTARQLFGSEDGSLAARSQQPEEPLPVYATIAVQRSALGLHTGASGAAGAGQQAGSAAGEPGGWVGSQPIQTVSPATQQRRRHLQLTESPVRVLYSVHAAFTGPPGDGLSPRQQQQQPEGLATRVPTPTCESAVQTEATGVLEAAAVVESGVQTELSSKRSSGSSSAASDLRPAAGPGQEAPAAAAGFEAGAGGLAPLLPARVAEAVMQDELSRMTRRASLASSSSVAVNGQTAGLPLAGSRGGSAFSAAGPSQEGGRMSDGSIGAEGASSSGSGASGEGSRQRHSRSSLTQSGVQEVYTLGGGGAGGQQGPAGSEQRGEGAPVAPVLVGAQDWYMSSPGSEDRRSSFDLGGLAVASGAPDETGRQPDGDDSQSTTSCYASAGHSHSSAASARPAGSKRAAPDHQHPPRHQGAIGAAAPPLPLPMLDAGGTTLALGTHPWSEQRQGPVASADADADTGLDGGPLDSVQDSLVVPTEDSPCEEERRRLLASVALTSSGAVPDDLSAGVTAASAAAAADSSAALHVSHSVTRGSSSLTGAARPQRPLDVLHPMGSRSSGAYDSDRSSRRPRSSSESDPESSSSGSYRGPRSDSGMYTQLGSVGSYGRDGGSSSDSRAAERVLSALHFQSSSGSPDEEEEDEEEVTSGRSSEDEVSWGGERSGSEQSAKSSGHSNRNETKSESGSGSRRSPSVASISGSGSASGEGELAGENTEEEELQQWLLSPGVGLSAEPLTAALPSRASFLTPASVSTRHCKAASRSSSRSSTESVTSSQEEQEEEASVASSAPASPRIPPPPSIGSLSTAGSPAKSPQADRSRSSAGSIPRRGGSGAEGSLPSAASLTEGQGSASSPRSNASYPTASRREGSHSRRRPGPSGASGRHVGGRGAEQQSETEEEEEHGREEGAEPGRSRSARAARAAAHGRSSSGSPDSSQHTPKRARRDLFSDASAPSPDLSDISSTAYAGGGYGAYGYYGSPRPSLYAAASDSTADPEAEVDPAAGAAGLGASAAAGVAAAARSSLIAGGPVPFSEDAAAASSHRDDSLGQAGSPAGHSTRSSPHRYPQANDLFHNPLYITPDGDAFPGGGRVRTPRDDGRGAIALPAMPYPGGGGYGGRRTDDDNDGASSCTSSPGPQSHATSQPSVGGSESGGAAVSGVGRRRRGRKSPLVMSPLAGGTPRTQRNSGSESEAGRGGSDAAAAAAAAAAGDVGAVAHIYGVERRGPSTSDGGGSSSSSGGDEGSGLGAAPLQPLKRPRTRMPDAPVLLPPLHSAASAPVGPAPHPHQHQHTPGAGQQPFRRHHSGVAPPPPPLASPLMVLNPTYATSEAGAPSMAASPRNASWSGNAGEAAVLGPAALAGSGGGVGLGAKGFGSQGSEGSRRGSEGGREPGRLAGSGTGDPSAASGPDFVTPKQQQQQRLLGGGGSPFHWSAAGTVQGSPTSQQAATAAALLRHANEAVDYARDAVQRGDGQWLSRVTATLQAVQSALDALREF